MIKTCVKPGRNLRAKFTQIFVQIFATSYFPTANHHFTHIVSHFSHSLFDSPIFSDPIRTFPLFHKPYYYHYDYFNNIKERI